MPPNTVAEYSTAKPVQHKISSFLDVPLEIRLRVYDLIHKSAAPIPIRIPLREQSEIAVEPDGSLVYDEDDTFDIEPQSLSSQFLRTCRAIKNEALPFLYSLNTFDLNPRETFKLLLHNAGTANCSLIRHIVLDWESLIEYSWALAKPEYQVGSRGLQSIQLLTWRNALVKSGGTRDFSIKSYVRQLYQCAQDILDKHPNLNVLAEETKVGTVGKTRRVKWRFVCSEEDIVHDREVLVDVKKDLVMLRAGKEEQDEMGFHVTMNDPF